MGALTDSAGLLFRIKADSSDATKEVGKFTGVLGTLDAQALATGGGLSALGGPAAIIATVFAAAGVAAIGLTTALFHLAESASEYGSAIHDASEQTGQSAETISAFKYAAETSGSSLEKVSGSLAKFSTLLGQAQVEGSKADKTLNSYGITARTTDEALAQAVLTIAQMTDSSKQSAAAAALFKDRTGEILPVIKSFNGDLPALIDKLRDMGLVMSDKDAAAADAFGDQLDTLKMQLTGVERQVGMATIPVFLDLASTLSTTMTQNQAYIRAFAMSVADGMNFVIARVKEAANVIRVLGALAQGDYIGASILLGTAMIPGKDFHGEGATAQMTGSGTLPSGGGGGKGGGGAGGGGKSNADEEAKKDLQTRIEYQQGLIERLKDAYTDAMEAARKAFEETGDKGLFGEQTLDAEKKFIDGVISARAEMLKLNDELGTLDKESGAELRTRLQKQWDDVRKLSKDVRDQHQKDNDAIAESDKKRADDHQKLLDQIYKDEIDNDERIRDLLIQSAQDEADEIVKANEPILENSRRRVERAEAYAKIVVALGKLALTLNNEEKRYHLNRVDEIDEEARKRTKEAERTAKDAQELADALLAIQNDHDRKLEAEEGRHKKAMKEIDKQTATPTPAAPDYEFGIARSWADFKQQVLDDGPEIGAVFEEIGSIGVNAFTGLANALGSVVEQWVLTGETGPAVMRKILATALASIAAEAAVRAIFELAKGFAALFLNPSEAAAHFKAAALFGAVGIAAGVAGRAVAGDAFKQQTATATGRSASSSQHSSSGQGQVYSSQPNQVVESGRNRPGGILGTIKIHLGMEKDGVIKVLKHSAETNGPFRGLVLDIAAG